MPTIAFGSEQPFGALTGWNYTSASVTVEKKRANALDEIGNEDASQLYDEMTNVTASFVAASTTAPTMASARPGESSSPGSTPTSSAPPRTSGSATSPAPRPRPTRQAGAPSSTAR